MEPWTCDECRRGEHIRCRDWVLTSDGVVDCTCEHCESIRQDAYQDAYVDKYEGE